MSTSPLCWAQSCTQEMWSHQCSVKRNGQLPWPADYALPNAAWDTSHLLLQGHIAALVQCFHQLGFHQALLVLSHWVGLESRLAFQLCGAPSTHCCLVFLLPRCRTLLVEVPLDRSTTFWWVRHSPHTVSIVYFSFHQYIDFLSDTENSCHWQGEQSMHYLNHIIALELRLAVGKSEDPYEFC